MKNIMLLLGVAFLAVVCAGCGDDAVVVHCAAGMKPPIKKLAEEFEKTTGTKINLSYGGSNTLLGQIKLSRKGDVYIAGDADYVDMAEKAGLVSSREALCYFIPVIMVQKGNRKGLKTLADLTATGVRVGQGDERAAAVGRLTPKILDLNGVDKAAWKKNVKIATPTVNELGLKIELKNIDAAVVWRCIALKYAEYADIVPIPADKNITPQVAAAVLTCAKRPTDAAAFLKFLVSERGLEVLTESGYTVDKP